MRIALGQLAAGSTPSESLDAIAEVAADAARSGAALLVVPEGVMGPFADAPAIAQAIDGIFAAGVRRLSVEHRIAIVAGMYERGPAQRAYNTVVAMAGGVCLGAYRKIHLFDGLGVRESDNFVKGDGDLLRFTVSGLRVGVMTCYDLRFPELARAHARAGCDLLLVPSAWYPGPLKEEQWSVLLRARAIENVCYVAAAGQPAPRFIGRSMVVDPRGIVDAAADERPRLVFATLDAAIVAEAREALPALDHIRIPIAPEAS
jgi:predicted amidohydrolase